jgi:hypothetical protein
VATEADSNEQILHPGGVSGGERRGEPKRRERGLSRHGQATNRVGIKGELMREDCAVSGKISGQRKKTVSVLIVGAHCQ